MEEPIASTEHREFETLLAEMPRIAEAVKALPESVQGRAFDALVSQLRGEGTPSSSKMLPGPRRGRLPRKHDKPTAPTSPTQRRRSSGPSAVKDLDLTPSGKQSFKAFVEEKQPETNDDKNVLSVYYLVETLGIDNITIDHVFTCYKDMRWREPGDLANSLALTASRKRFLDTSRLDSIKLTPAGRNHVLHDLPRN